MASKKPVSLDRNLASPPLAREPSRHYLVSSEIDLSDDGFDFVPIEALLSPVYGHEDPSSTDPPTMDGFRTVANISVCVPLDSTYVQPLTNMPFAFVFSAYDAPTPPAVVDPKKGLFAIQFDAGKKASLRSSFEVLEGASQASKGSEGTVVGRVWLFGTQEPVRLPDGKLVGVKVVATAWYRPVGQPPYGTENRSKPGTPDVLSGLRQDDSTQGPVFLNFAPESFGIWRVNGLPVTSSVGPLFVPVPGQAEFEPQKGPKLVFAFEALQNAPGQDLEVYPWYEKLDDAMVMHCPIHGNGATLEFTLQLQGDEEVRTVAQWIYEKSGDQIDRARLSVNFLSKVPLGGWSLNGLLGLEKRSRIDYNQSMQEMTVPDSDSSLRQRVLDLEKSIALLTKEHLDLNQHVCDLYDLLASYAQMNLTLKSQLVQDAQSRFLKGQS